MNPRPEGRMRKLGWCHNGYHTLAAAEVARRARLAGLDALIIKYGDPAFEGAIATAGITWGVERFALWCARSSPGAARNRRYPSSRHTSTESVWKPPPL